MSRVLMVSPHPVYSPRGTPISVLNRCRALSALGHQVDLVTYPVGEDVAVDGLRYLRARVPGVRQVPVGPSATKVVLNAAVAAETVARLLRNRRRYDVLHTHEEAGLIGAALTHRFRLPHVYDMGNDWADVLGNYGLAPGHPAVRMAGALEAAVVRRSDVVIGHFPTIAAGLAGRGLRTPVEVVTNVALEPDPDLAAVARLRRAWAPDGAALLVYAGTLEPYQGVDLLVDAVAELQRRGRRVRLVVAGGRPGQIAALQSQAADLGLAGAVVCIGQQPPGFVTAMYSAADVLVSPRRSGSNTPLKLFAYVRAGKPVVATDIPSHTQALDAGSVFLVEPLPESLATGVESALDQPRAARAVVAVTVTDYLAGVARAYQRVGVAVSEGSVGKAARVVATTVVNDPLPAEIPGTEQIATTAWLHAGTTEGESAA